MLTPNEKNFILLCVRKGMFDERNLGMTFETFLKKLDQNLRFVTLFLFFLLLGITFLILFVGFTSINLNPPPIMFSGAFSALGITGLFFTIRYRVRLRNRFANS